MHPVYEIEAKVRAYVGRKLTLQQLREWFVPMMGPLLALPDNLPAASLATVVELGLIEMRDGALSERQFRSLLRRQVEGTTRFMIEGNPDLTLSASATTTEFRVFDLTEDPSSTVHQATLADISP
jgi:hypothetical protein